MTNDYSLRKYSLQFYDNAMERRYKDVVFHHTIRYCRFAWGMVVLFGSVFGLLDRPAFGADAGTVLLVRLVFIAHAVAVMGLTFVPTLKRLIDWSSFFFILGIGTFCTFLTVMSDPSLFSPYFAGLVLSFTGIFSTAGLGFKYSVWALLANIVVFEIAVGFFYPVSAMLFVTYNFFLFTALLIFAYIGYLIEKISRKNFVVSSQLNDSLSKVKKLSGLLPICASCKKIRDDQGYWNQIELYIRDHSEADFSHGICPECVETTYGNKDWYKKRRKK